MLDAVPGRLPNRGGKGCLGQLAGMLLGGEFMFGEGLPTLLAPLGGNGQELYRFDGIPFERGNGG